MLRSRRRSQSGFLNFWDEVFFYQQPSKGLEPFEGLNAFRDIITPFL